VNDTELVPVPSEIVSAHRENVKESQGQSRKVGFGGGAGDLEPGEEGSDGGGTFGVAVGGNIWV
jgi:hypothetical protein